MQPAELISARLFCPTYLNPPTQLLDSPCLLTKILTDFPLVRLLFTNLVLANATKHTRTRCASL